MSAEVTIYVCKTQTDRDKAIGFLNARGYAMGDITVEQADLVTYDSKSFHNRPGETDITDGYVVKGVK